MKVDFIEKIVGVDEIHVGDILKGDPRRFTLDEPIVAILPGGGISTSYRIKIRGEKEEYGAALGTGEKVFVYCPHLS